MQYLPEVRSRPFQRIAAVLRFPLVHWVGKNQHPWETWVGSLEAAVLNGDHDAFLGVFSQIAVALAATKTVRFQLTTEDVEWVVSVLDRPDADRKTIFALLLATARAVEISVTPAQLAEATGEGESTWRKRATTIPGAVKHGKQWLVPVQILVAFDLITPEQHAKLTEADRAQAAKETAEAFAEPGLPL